MIYSIKEDGILLGKVASQALSVLIKVASLRARVKAISPDGRPFSLRYDRGIAAIGYPGEKSVYESLPTEFGWVPDRSLKLKMIGDYLLDQ